MNKYNITEMCIEINIEYIIIYNNVNVYPINVLT